MASKKVEGYIRHYEAILNGLIHLISDEGETTEEVQQVIDHALGELSGWYEMRAMFD